MKSHEELTKNRTFRRAPQGARGLKFDAQALLLHADGSRPARGAWVEITRIMRSEQVAEMSRPARGAWVEIGAGRRYALRRGVAPRKGRVG